MAVRAAFEGVRSVGLVGDTSLDPNDDRDFDRGRLFRNPDLGRRREDLATGPDARSPVSAWSSETATPWSSRRVSLSLADRVKSRM